MPLGDRGGPCGCSLPTRACWREKEEEWKEPRKPLCSHCSSLLVLVFICEGKTTANRPSSTAVSHFLPVYTGPSLLEPLVPLLLLQHCYLTLSLLPGPSKPCSLLLPSEADFPPFLSLPLPRLLSPEPQSWQSSLPIAQRALPGQLFP